MATRRKCATGRRCPATSARGTPMDVYHAIPAEIVGRLGELISDLTWPQPSGGFMNSYRSVLPFTLAAFLAGCALTAAVFIDRQDPRVADKSASSHLMAQASAYLNHGKWAVIPGYTYESFADEPNISGTGNGASGGTLVYVLNSGTCTGETCSGVNINTAPITVTLDNPGSTATITYQARAVGGAIVGASSAATNSATGVSALLPNVNASAIVTMFPPSSSGSTGTSSGSGSGGGGIVN